MIGIDRHGLVLPHIAQSGDEGDLAALALHIRSDVFHLLEEHLARVEREFLFLLVRVVRVVLRIGDRRNGEFAVGRIGEHGSACQQRDGKDKASNHVWSFVVT